MACVNSDKTIELMMNNEYFKDASTFLQKTASNIIEEAINIKAVESILFFALGMERILKGILYDLNPIYVYKNQDFKNTVSILYKDRLADNYGKNKEISNTPDADVLSFKLSLLRAKSISQTTEKYTSLLFSLSNFRDIIAHTTLSSLDLSKAKKMLLRDFFPLLKKYSDELNIPLSYFVGPHERKLVSISIENQEFVEEKLKLKIDSHQNRWEGVRNNLSFIEKMKIKTANAIQSSDIKRDSFYELMPCPACENDALLLINIDYDYSDGHAAQTGAFVSKLKCLFCHLIIEDYDEIDHLKLNALLTPEEDMEF